MSSAAPLLYHLCVHRELFVNSDLFLPEPESAKLR
jgi:hypothetical protein